MTKKKTVEEVRQLFESRGYTLLSEVYKGSTLPLDYRCSNGHQTKISFAMLQCGRGCAECGGTKKKTFDEVKNEFDKRGFTLLSAEYKINKSLLNYVCDQGHQTKISFSNLMNGKGCLECSGKRKKTIEEVRLAFNQRGYQLLTVDYKSNKSSLEYICSRGHQTKISFGSLMNGKGCLECGGSKKKTIEEVRLIFSQRGYQLLSTEYKDNKSLLNYICGKGHQTKICFDKLQNGKGCASCANHGFDPNKSAILYYLRFQFEGNFYYKIGITNNTTSKRFQSESTPYTIVKETVYPLGKEAYTQEQTILKKFSAYRYKGKPFLTTNGNTELFTRDVLQLDYSILTSCSV